MCLIVSSYSVTVIRLHISIANYSREIVYCYDPFCLVLKVVFRSISEIIVVVVKHNTFQHLYFYIFTSTDYRHIMTISGPKFIIFICKKKLIKEKTCINIFFSLLIFVIVLKIKLMITHQRKREKFATCNI